MVEEKAPPEHAPKEFVPREPGQSFFDAINANKRNSLLLMGAVTGIVLVMCLVLG